MSSRATVAVVGAGAWGTLLAHFLAQREYLDVTLWARRPAFAEALGQERENRRYVPGLKLAERLRVSANPEDLASASAAFMVVPSKGLREVMPQLPPFPALINCAKGIEHGTFKRLSQVMAEYQPSAQLAALSGPNLATEIARGLPAAATIAATDKALAKTVQHWLSQKSFRVYSSDDLVGLELGGAFKNVIALAAGVCDGLGLGDNAKASIVTRGLAEMVRLGTHLGGFAPTFYGLSGLGDLVATCSNYSSRNHIAGVRLAQGASAAELDAEELNAEGLPTARAVVEYADRVGLELPISQAVYAIAFKGAEPAALLDKLMLRDTKPEWT